MHTLRMSLTIAAMIFAVASVSGCEKERSSMEPDMICGAAVPVTDTDDAAIDAYVGTYTAELYWQPPGNWQYRDPSEVTKTGVTLSLSRVTDTVPYVHIGCEETLYVPMKVTVRTDDGTIDDTQQMPLQIWNREGYLSGPAENNDAMHVVITFRGEIPTGEIGKNDRWGTLNDTCGGVGHLPLTESMLPLVPETAVSELDGAQVNIDWGQGEPVSLVVKVTRRSETACYQGVHPDFAVTHGYFGLDFELQTSQGETVVCLEDTIPQIGFTNGFGPEQINISPTATSVSSFTGGENIEVLQPEILFGAVLSPDEDWGGAFVEYRMAYVDGRFSEGDFTVGVFTRNKNGETDTNGNPVFSKELVGEGTIIVTSP